MQDLHRALFRRRDKVHLIRSSLRYVNYRDRRKVAAALRAGIERARSEGVLGATEASVLLLALGAGGTDAILGLLLGEE